MGSMAERVRMEGETGVPARGYLLDSMNLLRCARDEFIRAASTATSLLAGIDDLLVAHDLERMVAEIDALVAPKGGLR